MVHENFAGQKVHLGKPIVPGKRARVTTVIRKFITLSTNACESPKLPPLFCPFFPSPLSMPPRGACCLSNKLGFKLKTVSMYHQDEKRSPDSTINNRLY